MSARPKRHAFTFFTAFTVGVFEERKTFPHTVKVVKANLESQAA